jgi:general stress protein 26
MGTENKYNEKAIEKIKELAEDIKTAMMVTNISQKPLSAIPMTMKRVDVEGAMWFLSPSDSDHNRDINQDADVQLLFSKPADMEFLSVFGKAEIRLDRSIIHDLYSKVDDNWFDGKDDDSITAIKFSPKEAYFWDSKDNKYVSIVKQGVSAFTGKDTDSAKSGKLDV